MDKDIAIKVENVSKTFKIPHEKISSLRGAFVNVFKKNTFEEFQALDDVSFEVKKGEFFGIIGRKNLKEIFTKNVLTCIKGGINAAFFQVLTGISKLAIVNLLKPPVLTARHGGVLFFKIKK